jgi:hypothetical protein
VLLMMKGKKDKFLLIHDSSFHFGSGEAKGSQTDRCVFPATDVV